jgi:hypothetical protein
MTSLKLEPIALMYLACLIMLFLVHPLLATRVRREWLRVVLFAAGTAALGYLFVGMWKAWLPALLLAFLTAGIRIIFSLRSKKSGGRDSLHRFLIEQAGLLLVSTGAGSLLSPQFPSSSYWFYQFPEVAKTMLICLYGLILLVPFGGTLIGHLIKPFQDQLGKHYPPGRISPVRGLNNGGTVIGYLERMLILIFILSGQFAGVGFLVAAKSILRFGEVKDGDNRKQAEYIIIGTFASFLLAILISLGLRALLGLKLGV